MTTDPRDPGTRGRDADDWLGGTGAIDWDDDPSSRPMRRSVQSGYPALDAPTAENPQLPETAAEHRAAIAIRRRRAIALLVTFVVFGALIWLVVAALGSDSSESRDGTLPTTTVEQPAATTAAPIATTPTTTIPPAETTLALTVDLPAGNIMLLGSSGEVVTQLQEGLTALGFEPGPADGDFGPLTGAAVVAFQQANRLEADGVVGVNTARELNAALAASASSG